MGEDRRPLLPPDRWRVVDKQSWQVSRDVLLGRDGDDFDLVQAVRVGGSRPDSFTVAERLTSRPLWLAESERDGTAWLRALVARRVAEVPQLDGDQTRQGRASEHVHDQLRRTLELPDITDAPSAETVWNQEVPSLIDRVIAHCLFGDVAIDPSPSPVSIVYSHQLIGGMLDWFADHEGGDVATLIRYALAAGLVDLGIKGGVTLCPPLDARAYLDPTWLGSALVDAATRSPLAVDHVGSLIAAVGHDPARLVWFCHGLVETAFDLLVIQRLTWLNPRLRVTIAPRRRRIDNDATHHDVAQMLRHRALKRLNESVAIGRVQVMKHGPGTAAPRLDKLHVKLLRELDWADAVVVKGGRNHELIVGTLARPLWTGYAVTREFTESQAGFDGRAAPLVFVYVPAGQRSWWGWRGRAHRALSVSPDRTVPACWVTVADRERRATNDPGVLGADLARLLGSWPKLHQPYGQPALHDIQDLTNRLARTTQDSPRDRELLQRAHQLIKQATNTQRPAGA